MSDFISSDNLPGLWEDILNCHWTFLETEEGKEKFEERLKLEGYLKTFLSVVPHDRKFYLPQTAQVLKQSIREMENFTARNGIIGFETVSQYANNLFTKPWRKEFRVLKTYSGTFQHEIKSNLIDAIKLFEAMGYRRLSDETLILDGPICPDQVTNVSRDAITAYVECRIMNQIYTSLLGMGIKCTLSDIFNYREKHNGGVSQTVQELSYAIQDRRQRKENLFNDSSYVTIKHPNAVSSIPAPPPPPYYHNVAQPADHIMQQQQQQQQQRSSLYGNQLQSHSCVLHPMATKLNSKLYAPQSTAPPPPPPPHMSHSQSLEHYSEQMSPQLPHRHSFDHQQQGCTAHHPYYQGGGHYQIPRPNAQYAQHLYESPYDCIYGGEDSLDGSSAASYAAVADGGAAASYAHPYNVSGNRFPLPYIISNQLNAHYGNPNAVTCNGVKGMDPYGTGSAGTSNGTNMIENMYAAVPKPTQSWNHRSQQINQVLLSSRQPLPSTNAAKDSCSYRQRMLPPEQLIDFDDRASLTAHDYHAHQHHNMQNYADRGDKLERQYKRAGYGRGHANGLAPIYAEPKDILCREHAMYAGTKIIPSDDAYFSNLYARPIPRGSRSKDASMSEHMTDKYNIRKTDGVQGYDDNNRKMQMELNNQFLEKPNGGGPRRKLSSHKNECDVGVSDLCYESANLANYDDFEKIAHNERSPTQATKNQDGVGSFESWDYVFQNLERSGYNKDLGERGDLLVQSLDLDSLNLTGGGGGVAVAADAASPGGNNQSQNVEKRRSNNHTTDITKTTKAEKSRTLEKVTTNVGDKRETKTTKPDKPSILKQTNVANGGIKKNKSTLKSTATSMSMSMSNNLNVDHGKSNGTETNERNITRQNTSSSNGEIVSQNKNKTWTARSKQAPLATQGVVSSPNEWSCKFCTFLNPDTKRICEMCCRSKDLNMEATVSNTPTCV